jgi:phospholipase C
MKLFSSLALVVVGIVPPAFCTVTVSSPANGSTVSSPVKFAATAASASCAKGVSAMGIYVNNTLSYKVSASSLSTSLALSTGVQHVVVQEWDGCNGSSTASLTLMVKSGTATTTTVSMTANPSSITTGASSTLSVSASNATAVTISGTNGSSYTLAKTGGTQMVKPAVTTTYTAHATGAQGNTTASATVTVEPAGATTVSMTANPSSITTGGSSTLSVTATSATAVKISGNDGSSYTLATTGGTEVVSPAVTTTYTATATGAQASPSAEATVTVQPASSLQAISHVIFMLQENHTFDNYFGMLNPYREANGWNIGQDGKTYNVDGIDDKLTKISDQDDEGATFPLFKFKTTCIDDATSAWLESFGDVNRYDFSMTRAMQVNGFVHTAEGFAKSCVASKDCSGTYTDLTGQRAMGYYDQGYLNYYYFMASQFAVSDRWFSPVASKSVDNRIATFTGGTTQGLVRDPGNDDKLPQLDIPTIFQELDKAGVSWRIYYTVTQGNCLDPDDCAGGQPRFPGTDMSYLTYVTQYLYENPTKAACRAPTVESSTVGDASNSFCIDRSRIAPLSTYYTDLRDGLLPSFAFIEAGYGNNDEHPGSGQSILVGQQEVANVLNAFMTSPMWGSSVFFLAYDEGGGPYDHVPPVPGHSNVNTDASLGTIPDISGIAVSPDAYKPCVPVGGVPTLHCDLTAAEPGAKPTDAAAVQGFGAQLGFRVPNMVVSPFVRKHYVSHTPMDHTAILKFVENRFIGPSAHLTARDAAQPNLLEFFDFSVTPWATPPSPPTPVSASSLGRNTCTPTTM